MPKGKGTLFWGQQGTHFRQGGQMFYKSSKAGHLCESWKNIPQQRRRSEASPISHLQFLLFIYPGDSMTSKDSRAAIHLKWPCVTTKTLMTECHALTASNDFSHSNDSNNCCYHRVELFITFITWATLWKTNNRLTPVAFRAPPQRLSTSSSLTSPV